MAAVAVSLDGLAKKCSIPSIARAGCNAQEDVAAETGSSSEPSALDSSIKCSRAKFGARHCPEAMDETTYFKILRFMGRAVPLMGVDVQAADACSDSSDEVGDVANRVQWEMYPPDNALTVGSDTPRGQTPNGRQIRDRGFSGGQTMRRMSHRIVDRVQVDVQTVIYNEEFDYSAYELMLRQDLAGNKLRWYGAWSRDLWCFLRNNNPVLSLCYSHRLHPISRKNRWVAMFLQVLFLLFISSVITEARMCLACGFTDCGAKPDCILEHVENITNSTNRTDGVRDLQFFPGFRKASWRERKQRNLRFSPELNFCCTANKIYAMWVFEHFGICGGIIFGVMANCIFALTVFPLMMCACVQSLSPRFRKLGEWFGYGLVGLMAAVLVSFTPFLIRYCTVNQMFGEFLVNLSVGKLGGWLCVTVVNVVAFTVAWLVQGGAVKRSFRTCSCASTSNATSTSGSDCPCPPAPSGHRIAENGLGIEELSPGGGKKRYHVTAEDYTLWTNVRRKEHDHSSGCGNARYRAEA